MTQARTTGTSRGISQIPPVPILDANVWLNVRPRVKLIPEPFATFQVLVDGMVVDTVNKLTGIAYRPLTTSSFTLTAGSHTITFQGTDLNGGDMRLRVLHTPPWTPRY